MTKSRIQTVKPKESASTRSDLSPPPCEAQIVPIGGIALGIWLGVLLLKSGNPVVLADKIPAPEGLADWIWGTWPVSWSSVLFFICLLVCVIGWILKPSKLQGLASWKNRETLLLLIPSAWLIWQWFAGLDTIDQTLTAPTLKHFATATGCFYLAFLTAKKEGGLRWLLWSVFPFFLLMIRSGWNQHFGGLAATREWFFSQPDWQSFPREYVEKLSSDRIFATLVYPNALAQAVLIWTPALCCSIWYALEKCSKPARWILTSLVPAISVPCLVWSQSKAGWLAALAMVFVLILRISLPNKFKWAAVALLLTLGLTGFFVRYADYFRKGATSVGARMDYWTAAWTTANNHPWSGTGPGTFMVSYAKIKPPEAEMARLAHNDYLQQASDSGWPGFLLYLPLFPLSLLGCGKHSWRDPLLFSVWLGLFAWTFQSAVEFGLYIPALSCAAFTLAGWVVGSKTVDTTTASG